MNEHQRTQWTVNGVTMAVYEAGEGTPVLLLHGFTGSGRSFSTLFDSLAKDYHVLAPDLLGHGESDAPSDWPRYALHHISRDIESFLEQRRLTRVVVVGYSMGGRIALSFACDFPARVQALVLESASPGLAAEEAREARVKQDWELAGRILRDGVEQFVDFWEANPLFRDHATRNPQAAAEERSIRLSQRAVGLAGSLKGGGTGAQTPRWRELALVSCPVLLLTGSRDEKFTGIAEAMLRQFPNARHVIVARSGHTIHLEDPSEFEKQLRTFLVDKVADSQNRHE